MRLPAIRSLNRKRVLISALVVLVAAAGLSATLIARSGSSPNLRIEDAMMTVPAGPGSPDTVDLDTRLYLPDESTPQPAILLAHGFGGDKFSIDGQAKDLAARGFVVLT